MDNSENIKLADDFIKSFKTLEIKVLQEQKILSVTLNRPKSLNALNETMFLELHKLFTKIYEISKAYDIRVVILSGNGKSFCAGLDLKSEIALNILQAKSNTEIDIGRKAFILYHELKKLQNSLTALENCHLPIIAAVHGHCLGGAMSLLSCCDIVISTKNAQFSIREVDIGLTADIGLLQRIGKQIGNINIAKKLSFTGENFNGEEAKMYGFVQEIAENEKVLQEKAFALAEKLCSKSPLVLWGIKRTINYSRDNTVDNSLEHIAAMNSAFIQADDISESIKAVLGKKKAMYPKL
jgi:enoyl-CoA hydratase/carnithine racemase